MYEYVCRLSAWELGEGSETIVGAKCLCKKGNYEVFKWKIWAGD